MARHVAGSDFTSNSCEEKICCFGLQNFGLLFCFCKMNKRSYADVVSGSGKFIFAQLSVLFGVWCLPQCFISLSGSSESESELLCRQVTF